MITRRFTAVLVAATIMAGGATVLPIWPQPIQALAQSPYTSPDGDFSIAFPVTPKISARSEAGDFDPGYQIYVADDGGRSFMVRVDQYPTAIPVPVPNQRTYELLLHAHALERSSRLVSMAPVQFAGRPAIQGVFTTVDGATEQMRVLIVGHRLYQVSYTHADGAGTPGEGDALMDSFKVTAR